MREGKYCKTCVWEFTSGPECGRKHTDGPMWEEHIAGFRYGRDHFTGHVCGRENSTGLFVRRNILLDRSVEDNILLDCILDETPYQTCL